jgi:hypothetical protein
MRQHVFTKKKKATDAMRQAGFGTTTPIGDDVDCELLRRWQTLLV